MVASAEVFVSVTWFPLDVKVTFVELSRFMLGSRSNCTFHPLTAAPELFVTVPVSVKPEPQSLVSASETESGPPPALGTQVVVVVVGGAVVVVVGGAVVVVGGLVV